ncbi:anti-sigma factor family protein [Planctomycetota bacterium]
MKPEQCKELEEQLVDYADGLLDEETSREVAEHLASCVSCRDKVDALNRSLDLIQTIWQDNLEQSIQAAVVPIRSGSRLRRWLYGGPAAAAVLLVLLLAIYRYAPSRQAYSPVTVEQLEYQIEAEASAARLLATAELLSQKPHAAELAQSQYQYLLDHYPATQAGIQARKKQE